MGKNLVRFGILIGVVLSLTMIFPINTFAEKEKGFDAKKRAFCRMMLNHGRDAYSRGDYEKAGYYLQQAVQADPAYMAKTWFNRQGEAGDEEPASASEEITPTPSTATPQPEKPAEESEGVIMGDDEGC
jgi:hypothetical protein